MTFNDDALYCCAYRLEERIFKGLCVVDVFLHCECTVWWMVDMDRLNRCACRGSCSWCCWSVFFYGDQSISRRTLRATLRQAKRYFPTCIEQYNNNTIMQRVLLEQSATDWLLFICCLLQLCVRCNDTHIGYQTVLHQEDVRTRHCTQLLFRFCFGATLNAMSHTTVVVGSSIRNLPLLFRMRLKALNRIPSG